MDHEVDGNMYRMVSGQEAGGKTEADGPLRSEKCWTIQSTTAEEQAEAEATSKWKKKLKSGAISKM